MSTLDRWMLLGIDEPEDDEAPARDELADVLLFGLVDLDESDPVVGLLASIADDLDAFGARLPARLDRGSKGPSALARRVRIAQSFLEQCDGELREQLRAVAATAPDAEAEGRDGETRALEERREADDEDRAARDGCEACPRRETGAG